MGKAIAAAAVAVVCVLALTAFVATRRGSHPRLIDPNSVGVIDATNGTLVADVAVGDRTGEHHGGLRFCLGRQRRGRDGLADRRELEASRSARFPPVRRHDVLASNGDGVWVGSGTSVVRINPEFDNVVSRTPLDREQPSPSDGFDGRR